MLYAFLLFVQIVFLYLISKQILKLLLSSKQNSKFRKIRFFVFAVFFLPGTFLHELSHFVMAKLLGVRVEKFNLFPVFAESKIVLGSVSLQKTDFIRRFIVGVAPLFFGIAILSILGFFLTNYRDSLSFWSYAVFVFLIFVISNTMFLSDKDLAGSWKFYIFLLFVVVILYFILRYFDVEIYQFLDQMFQNIYFFVHLLVYPLLINLFCLLIVSFLSKN
ncbi:MAG: hypothetical protein N2558_03825 [Patescibacteria group bacterium]|nr:hypothetical protein [Patescibacteria group bacterium]